MDALGLDALGASGAVVAVVAGGRSRVRTAGVLGGRRVDASSLFQAASSGKHVMACVVLALAQRGGLDLDAPVGDSLPELPEAWGRRPVRTLLHHTSGLPDYLAAPGAVTPTSAADFLAACDRLAPFAEAGACWSYSNTNYILLGLVAARAAGRPAGTAMQELLALAGAPSAAVASPAWVRRAAQAPEQRAAGDAESLAREVIGDGDVAFDAEAALSWMRALLDARVGGPDLFAAAALAEGAPAPYGCGLFLEPLGGASLAHHAGHYDGFTAALVLNRDMGAGVFALCDGAPGHTRAIRALALRELEAFRPGATPLARVSIADGAPEVTRRVRAQLVRGDAAPDADAFAPPLRTAILAAPPGRGVVNLSGEGLAGFHLVDEREEPGRTMRRYRLTYPERVEHVCVGLAPDGRIDWAWPL